MVHAAATQKPLLRAVDNRPVGAVPSARRRYAERPGWPRRCGPAPPAAFRRRRRDVLRSMLPLYRELIGAGLRILVYSGDVDAIVPGEDAF